MLETNILDQVRSIFQPLEARYTFHITCNPKHEQARELIDFLNEIASCSDKLSCRLTVTETSGPERGAGNRNKISRNPGWTRIQLPASRCTKCRWKGEKPAG